VRPEPAASGLQLVVHPNYSASRLNDAKSFGYGRFQPGPKGQFIKKTYSENTIRRCSMTLSSDYVHAKQTVYLRKSQNRATIAFGGLVLAITEGLR
jgi:hypothetical protein